MKIFKLKKIWVLLNIIILIWHFEATASVFNIGPGQTYSSLNNFAETKGWHTLLPGDIVNIHWQSQPYREFIYLSESGTEGNPIIVRGVPNSNGDLPILDGQNAILSPALQFNSALTNLGLLVVFRRSAQPYEYSPEHLRIENLVVRNANNDFTFTAASGAITRWHSFAAAIRVQRAKHIVIDGCTLTGSGNGLFLNSIVDDNNGNGIFDSGDVDKTSSDVLISHNIIYGNGESGNQGQHNIYTEAQGVTFEYNYVGSLAANAGANILKDRSSNTVIRYNYFYGGNSGHILDLVESEAGAPIICKAPNYSITHVYGNVFVNPPSGSYTIFHYSGDHGDYGLYRRGRLEFYNNTVINIANQAQRWETMLFLGPRVQDIPMSTDCEEYFSIFNNVFYNVPATPGSTPTSLGMLQTFGSVTFNARNNFISVGYFDGKSDYYNSGTGSYDPLVASMQYSGNLVPANNDPGFVDFINNNYHLMENSILRNAGLSSLIPALHPPAMEYLDTARGILRAPSSYSDLGAFGFSSLLPLNLVYFEAALSNSGGQNKVNVQIKVENHSSNDTIILQKSYDGIDYFDLKKFDHQVSGLYEFQDFDLQNIQYYRVKIIAHSNVQFSAAKLIQLKPNSTTFYILPTAAGGFIQIKSNDKLNANSPFSCRVYDTVGRELMRFGAGLDEEIDISALMPGIYYFSIWSNNRDFIHKFVKN
jgi:hypothetical protein